MSDQAGGSDHLTKATSQSGHKDERMVRQSSQEKQGIVTLSVFAFTDQVVILI